MIATTRPPIRLRPVPAFDPPYEDEVSPDFWGAQLALQFDLTGRRRARPPIPIPGVTPLTTPAPDAAPAVVPPASPEARRAAKRFLDTCLEIFNGYRPIAHVRPLTVPALAEAVIEQLGTGVDRTARLRRGQRPGPAGRGQLLLLRVRRLHVCEPRPGAAEAAAALSLAGRTWAYAFRLERRRGSWLCTAARVV